jgi:tripartite ATP-independent transporter DctM subunit
VNGWLAIVMFAVFVGVLLSGYPVALSFVFTAVAFTAVGIGLGEFDAVQLRALPSRWFGLIQDQTLLAIPFFVYMGAIFEKSGQAERMLTAIGRLMGPVRGGLALATVLVGTLLAAATGVVAATVIMMGLISLPAMIRHGYDHRLATGVIAASGTLAQLLPPSLVLIVLASQTRGVSVGALFRGAVIPGLLLAALYAAYVGYVAVRHPHKAPALPPVERVDRRRALVRESLIAILPPSLLILCVLGAIFQGIATPSEVGAVGAVGAAAIALANRRLSWGVIGDAARSTAGITGMVMMMLLASNYFAYMFDLLGGQDLVAGWLTGLPGGYWSFVVVANVAVFLLGVNLEFLEISFIAMPILTPIAAELGIDMVWFVVMIAVNLNIAFISPPVGFSLFYLQSVKPGAVRTSDIHRGALPFVAIQLVALTAVMLCSPLVTWLAGTS